MHSSTNASVPRTNASRSLRLDTFGMSMALDFFFFFFLAVAGLPDCRASMADNIAARLSPPPASLSLPVSAPVLESSGVASSRMRSSTSALVSAFAFFIPIRSFRTIDATASMST